MRYHDFRAMNTDILLAAEGPTEQVGQGFQETEAFIHVNEQRFTRFSNDSELTHLNNSAGNWFDASPELYEVMSLALEMHNKTKGLFDPGILPALERAGYDRSMDEIRMMNDTHHEKQEDSSPQLTLQQMFHGIHLDEQHQRILLPVGLRIDLGGIAKGWIAEKAAYQLAKFSDACAVDAGGDAFMIGRPLHDNQWRVTLEDPCDSNRAMAFLKLHPGAVATSAITRRRWKKNGKEMHHLIDPRTLQPAKTEWQSVTVVAPHAVEAEVYAKCLLIGGPREAERLIQINENIEFIVIDKNNRLWGSKNSRELLDD